MKIKIPLYVKKAARAGLRLRSRVPKSKKFGLTKKEADKLGIQSGVEQAKYLIKNNYIDYKRAWKIAKFYNRFKNCYSFKCNGNFLLWGTRKWGNNLYRRIKKDQNFKKSKNIYRKNKKKQ